MYNFYLHNYHTLCHYQLVLADNASNNSGRIALDFRHFNATSFQASNSSEVNGLHHYWHMIKADSTVRQNMYTIICICVVPLPFGFFFFTYLTHQSFHFIQVKKGHFHTADNHTETGYSSFSGRLSPSCKCCSLPYIWILDTMEYCCSAALGGRGVVGVLQNQSKKACVRERQYREALRSCCPR